MVKIVGPLHSAEARGRLGIVEYNSWRSVHYVKRHTDPPPPVSPGQVAQQNRFTVLSKAWSTLADSQRLAWRTFARQHPQSDWTGVAVRLTGLNMFIRANTWRLKLELSILPLPAVVLPVGAPVNVILDSDLGSWRAVWSNTGAPGPPFWNMEFRTAGPYSPARCPDFKRAVCRAYPLLSLGTVTFAQPNSIAQAYYGMWYRFISRSSGWPYPWAFAHLQMQS